MFPAARHSRQHAGRSGGKAGRHEAVSSRVRYRVGVGLVRARAGPGPGWVRLVKKRPGIMPGQSFFLFRFGLVF